MNGTEEGAQDTQATEPTPQDFLKKHVRGIPREKMKEKNDDIQTGINIVRRALEEPIRQIAGNAGFEGSIVVQQAKEEQKAARGFDAYTGKWIDMFDAGIIDKQRISAYVAFTLGTTFETGKPGCALEQVAISVVPENAVAYVRI